ncbi:MAG TPA: hypothetical protein VJK52_00465 [Candidatus Nanoarchaeia archaeon]|nr:hypothetical protein [Candidatus Nanoarchaeia archaeon]
MKFPQFTRFFSATLLLGLMGVLLGMNAYLASNHPVPSLPQEVMALKEPWTEAAHEQLAGAYWQQGKLADAARELEIVGSVLGVTTYKEKIQQWNLERTQKEAALAYWKNISTRYPNYRDAYSWMGALSYELGKGQEARQYLTAAISLDHYSDFPKRLLAEIE